MTREISATDFLLGVRVLRDRGRRGPGGYMTYMVHCDRYEVASYVTPHCDRPCPDPQYVCPDSPLAVVRGEEREECTGKLSMMLRWDLIEASYGVDPEKLVLELDVNLPMSFSVDLVRTLERRFAGQGGGEGRGGALEV